MDMLRRFGGGMAVLIVSFCLSLLALFVALYMVFDSPQPLKQALRTSGVYETSIQSSLPEASDTTLLVSDPGIQQAFVAAFPPDFAKISSERAIDSIYAWARGQTPKPDFSIDLTPVKQNFASNTAQDIEQKLAALPLCAMVTAPPTSAEEVLNLTCRPRGISLDQIGQMVRQEILATKLFSDTDTIDTASLKDVNGQPLSDQLSFVPVAHRYFVISLYVVPVLLLLGTIAIIFWSVTKRAGVKRMAWLLVVIGLTNIVFSIVEVWLLHAGVSIFAPASATPAVQDKLLIALEILATQLRDWWLGFGVSYVVLGVMLLIILAFVRPRPKLTMGQSPASNIQNP
ncbi:MAG TPA: hypothetical protein VFH06_04495 [Candidatus Saccharimonadales bacterium]|nr:hypothetical protein [Candidatus Saccharimonadales bacterium]